MKAVTKHIKKHCIDYGILGVALVFVMVIKWDDILPAIFDGVTDFILKYQPDPIKAGEAAVVPCVIIGMFYALICVAVSIPCIYSLVWITAGSSKVIDTKIENLVLYIKLRYATKMNKTAENSNNERKGGERQ